MITTHQVLDNFIDRPLPMSTWVQLFQTRTVTSFIAKKRFHWAKKLQRRDTGYRIGHFRVPLCQPFLWKWLWFAWKWNYMQNSVSYERFRTLTRFEREAQENSDMAYCNSGFYFLETLQVRIQLLDSFCESTIRLVVDDDLSTSGSDACWGTFQWACIELRISKGTLMFHELMKKRS